MLFDTGMRPEECHSLRWENVSWNSGRNGIVLVAKGKTKAALGALRFKRIGIDRSATVSGSWRNIAIALIDPVVSAKA